MPVQVAKWDSVRDAWTDESRIDLFSELSDAFLETFPTSGMTLNGVAYELPTWEPRMDDSGSSSWRDEGLFRTPMADEGRKASNRQGAGSRKGHQIWLTSQIVDLMLLKTPTSQLAVNGGSQHPDKRKAGGHGPTLADEVEHLLPTATDTSATALLGGQSVTLLPTPTVGMTMGGSETRSGSRSNEKLLPGVAKDLVLLPTPVAQPSGNTPEDHLRKKPGRQVVTDLAILTENGLLGSGGRLLPTPQAHDAQKGKTADQVAAMRARGHGVMNLNELAENELVKLLPTTRAQHGEERNQGIWARDLAQPQNLENSLARLPGATTNPLSDDGNESLDGQLPGQLNLLDEIAESA